MLGWRTACYCMSGNAFTRQACAQIGNNNCGRKLNFDLAAAVEILRDDAGSRINNDAR